MYWDAEDDNSAALALIKRYVIVVMSFVIYVVCTKIFYSAITRTDLFISASVCGFFYSQAHLGIKFRLFCTCDVPFEYAISITYNVLTYISLLFLYYVNISTADIPISPILH